MTSISNIIKRGIKASFFCLTVLLFAVMITGNVASAAVSTFDTPDFAFPKTVSKTAGAEYKKALAERRPVDALKAAIQLSVADALVSEDNYAVSAARFDTLAVRLPAPFAGLASLLEATIYKEMWSGSRWVYNNRTLPLTPRPSNATEWSTPMFAAEVTELVEHALKDSDRFAAVPLSEISGILENSADAVKAGFSVTDFMQLCGAKLLDGFPTRGSGDTLPFGNKVEAPEILTPDAIALGIIDSAIGRHSDDKDMFILSLLYGRKLNMLSGQKRTDFLKVCYDRFADTPYGASFVAGYAGSLEDSEQGDMHAIRRQMYDILKAYIFRYPDARDISSVQSAIRNLEERRISVTYPNRLLPGVENRVKVTGSNVYDFYVLVYSLPGNDSDMDYTYASLSTGAKLLKAIPVKINGSTPDRFTDSISVPALSPGYYAFVPSLSPTSGGILEKNKKSYLSSTLVSGISFITSTISKSSGEREMFVVSSFNQQPVKNAKVSLYSYKNGRKGNIAVSKVTDEQGKVTVPEGEYYYMVRSEGSSVSGRLSKIYTENENPTERLRGELFTDLSIYRPGEKVNFSVVAYTWKDKETRAASGRELRLVLMDANGQPADTLQLTTDRFGRADGSFTLSESGLLGNWMIYVTRPEKSEWVASGYFTVAEYKSPTFYVTVDSSSESYKAGETISFSGRAMTYSGLPVSNGKVSYTVRYRPLWWRMVSGGGEYGGETVTGNDGSFRIELPTENLIGTEYADAGYTLDVTVTDQAGESQTAPSVQFSMGDALRILPEFNDLICADRDYIDFKVTVRDLLYQPVRKTVYYQIKSGDNTVAHGEFISPVLNVPSRLLSSGRYRLRLSLTPDFNDDEDNLVVKTFTVWRRNDRKPPVSSILWIPEKEIIVPAGEERVTLKVGSSYNDSYMLVHISDTHRFLESRWIKVSDGFVEVKINAPAADERLFVTVSAMRDLNRQSQTVTVIPYDQSLNLKISAETFRDKIEPGARESWKFLFSYDNHACASLPAMAVMSNKALNALAPFQWAFNPYNSIYWSAGSRMTYPGRYDVTNNGQSVAKGVHTKTNPFRFPTWNTYGFSLYSGNVAYSGGVVNELKEQMMFKSAAVADSGSDAAPRAESEEIRATVNTTALKIRGTKGTMHDSIEEAEVEGDAGTDGNPTQEEVLRSVECPKAFFMPSLVTDSEGVANVDFTAPDFTGTWQFQIVGYTDAMKGASLMLDAVSSKKVMVNLNEPRFLRTGDIATISATLFNNSDMQTEIEGRIEVIDAVTGNTLISYSPAARSVEPSASCVINTEFMVPAETEALVIRCYASVPGHRDGEQTIVPVLPSSTPVIEAVPFYIAPSVDEFTMKLPRFEGDAKITLTYCDNPVWECVTALPSILVPESVSILSQVRALFGNAVASGIFRRYPAIAEGVMAMAAPVNAADSSLYSPLQKNGDLKIVALGNTPWVRDAQSETLRMADLVKYADQKEAEKAVADIISVLEQRQNSDGGWSWCPDMKTSAFITTAVFHTLAMLSNMGYLPAGGEKLAGKAAGYLDKTLAEEWNRNKRKYFSLSELLGYLYDKSAFRSMGSSAAFRPLETLAIAKIGSDWRNLTIMEKAQAAILLERKGQPKISRLILESLAQFASESPEKGMWFDNLKSGYRGDASLITTARVLEAYALIEPQNPVVDKLRQWLVMSKQTQNWGDNPYCAEAINAILTSGSEWTQSSGSPEFLLDGMRVGYDHLSSITGSVVVNLDPAGASDARLTVKRTGVGPAWGGVVSQYVAPVLDVKQNSIPELSVAKEIYVVTPGTDGITASAGEVRVGDKVRVTLTVTCDRDLEYVALTDERAACLEPAVQLSGYTQTDGVWYYMEIRDRTTNLFIPFLSKGTHVVTYDCYADRAGVYSLGIATAQSQYAPELSAHSAGREITVNP